MSWSLVLLSPSSASFEEESTSTALVFKTIFPDLIAISIDFDEDSFVRPFFIKRNCRRPHDRTLSSQTL
ncbi:hypothetical protein AXF42_Ash011207 [Apostasia shenzhenica]|uniref:Uncharacterized protein n=1 Tax=Apostasia shenzhenica TaxID=1088818 RepID=A0A2I0AL55_9ASPA|nr:hypothetical protein AXF42_Ash011207 [Apostasia shenzhenica]